MIEDVKALVGRSIETQDQADRHRWQAYRSFFKLAQDEPAAAFHWLMFTALPEESRADGHAAVMAPFPPLPLPRRMWAGGEINWIEPIGEGDALTRASSIIRADAKHGSTGDLLVTSVQHRISRGSVLCVDERQDVIFMPAADKRASPPLRPLGFEPDWEQPAQFDEVALFRYSALTFNSHRIHYDVAYARDVEHYPDLVVHGPLLASSLIHAGVRSNGKARPVKFSYRAVAPAFVGEELKIVGRRVDDALELAVVGADGGARTTGVLYFNSDK